MKKILIFIVCAATLTACTKTPVAPASQPQPTALNTQPVLAAGMSKTSLICAHTWWYERAYLGYTGPGNPGTLEFQRGHTTNTLKLARDTVKFFPNGDYREVTGSTPSHGKWAFTGTNQSAVTMQTATGPVVYTIILLTTGHGNWTTPITGLGETEFAEMVPKPE